MGKKEVESISHRIETETKNLAEKEEVQKVLTPLMAKLAVAKKKFVSMTQKKKNKKNKDGDDEDEREEQGVEVELGKEEDAQTVSERQKAEEDEKKQDATTTTDEKTRSSNDADADKAPSGHPGDEVVSRAKDAVKVALEKAESALKKAADKFGIKVSQTVNDDGSVEMSI